MDRAAPWRVASAGAAHEHFVGGRELEDGSGDTIGDGSTEGDAELPPSPPPLVPRAPPEALPPGGPESVAAPSQWVWIGAGICAGTTVNLQPRSVSIRMMFFLMP